MTTTLDETATEQPVFIWFAQPDVGREELLMVLLDGPEGTVHRPLMALDVETAASQQARAQDAANALGVTAVLREYQFVSLVDRVEPTS